MNGKFGCPKCGGTGIITGEFGLNVECECVREMQEATGRDKVKPLEKIVAPNIFGEMSSDEKIVRMKLVPAHRINDAFSGEHVKIVAVQMGAKLKCDLSSLADMDRYLKTLEGILAGLRSRKVPERSYIIGASNGFGKTTFANNAIKIMAANGMKAVPYISLTELAEKWTDAMVKLRDRIEYRGKKAANKFEKDDEGEELQVDYDWSDYVNADLTIVYLTSTNELVMWAETQCLKTLLELRDTKGKPTIVFTSESIDWYMNSENVSKYMTSHIIEAQPDLDGKSEFNNKALNNTVENRYDKLEHLSVYMKPKKN